MKNDYITRARKFVPIINDILNNADNNKMKIQNYIEEYNIAYKRKVIFSWGIARYAFITSDYVIKVEYDTESIDTYGGCEDEMRLYGEAKLDNMEYLFAEITRYTYHGTNYYIMPRIKGIGKTYCNAYEYMNDKEFDWCHKHNISDLHMYNYGQKKNQICIVDYACCSF